MPLQLPLPLPLEEDSFACDGGICAEIIFSRGDGVFLWAGFQPWVSSLVLLCSIISP